MKELPPVGWRGYNGAYPGYVIHPRRLAEFDDMVAVLGHTTGSHLGLSDGQERELTLIWLARVRAGRVTAWTLIEDTAENRGRCRLD
jgi:hypothetical protein